MSQPIINREDQILIEEYQALNANVTSRGQETGTYVTTGIIGAVLIGTAALASLGLSGPLFQFQTAAVLSFLASIPVLLAWVMHWTAGKLDKLTYGRLHEIEHKLGMKGHHWIYEQAEKTLWHKARKSFAFSIFFLILLAVFWGATVIFVLGFTLSLTSEVEVDGINELIGPEWVLEAVDREGARSLIDYAKAPTITFDRNEISGFGGCNQYSGSFRLRGPHVLVIEVLATTLRACPEAGDIEMSFFEILTEPMTFRVEEKLELYSTASDTVLTFSRS